MNESSNVDLLFSTIAVVFEPIINLPPLRITDEVLADILKRPLNLGNAPGGELVIASPRDSVEVQLAPNKIDVRNVSGSATHGQNLMPRVVHEFVKLLGNPTLVSYGINFVAEVPQEAPGQWLVNSLLHPDTKEYFGDAITSNQVNLTFPKGRKDVTLQIGVGGRNRININFNASEHINGLPSEDSLESGLVAQYDVLNQILDKLGVT